MFPLMRDPALPGLADLGPHTLRRITGREARILRVRYRAGERAILHVGFEDGSEGSVWFYSADKARKLAAKRPGAVFDPDASAFFEAFPHDHRMPQIAQFLTEADALAPALMGADAASPPELVRYRPGVSATFRWMTVDGREHFVKLVTEADVCDLAQRNRDLAAALGTGSLAVSEVSGITPDLGCICYHATKGDTLEALIRQGRDSEAAQAVSDAIAALETLWRLPLRLERRFDRAALLAQARSAVKAIGVAEVTAGVAAEALLADLTEAPATPRCSPIHADIKPEHLFVSPARITLIDTESLSLGDPDCDLAALDARLMAAEAAGWLQPGAAGAMRARIRAAGGPCYDWFQGLARLDVARHFAQHPGPDAVRILRLILRH